MQLPSLLIVVVLVATSSIGSTAQAPFAELSRKPGPPASFSSFPFADVDRDGIDDIFGGIGIVPIDAFGNFGSLRFIGRIIGSYAQAGIGDVDGDGDVDTLLPSMAPVPTPDQLYFNDGTGNFTDVSATHIPPTDNKDGCALLCDVDGDGDLDAVLGMTRRVPLGFHDRNVIWLNDGTGHFAEDRSRASLPPDQDDTIALAAADIDGDGDLDLIVGNDASYFVTPARVYTNDGTGQFSWHQDLALTVHPVIRLADIDGDGDLDLGLFAYGSTGFAPPKLFRNDGGRFTDISANLPSQSMDFQGAAFGDVDEDGDVDIVVPRFPPLQVGPNDYLHTHQWINDGTGRFHDLTASAPMPTYPNNWSFSRLELVDLDGDGDLDLIADDPEPMMAPFHNHVIWNLTRQVYAPAPPRIGQSYTLEIHADVGTVVVPAAAFAAARTPLPGLGVLGLDPASIVVAPSFVSGPSRLTTLTFVVPNDPRLVGRAIYWQALVADPATGRLRLTNTFDERFVQ